MPSSPSATDEDSEDDPEEMDDEENETSSEYASDSPHEARPRTESELFRPRSPDPSGPESGGPTKSANASSLPPESLAGKAKTLADLQPLVTPGSDNEGKAGGDKESQTMEKGASTGPKGPAKTDKRRKPEFSASLLSQQIAEASADIYQQRRAEMRDRKIVYAAEVKTNRLVVAAYEQAWQEKVERIGNLNYPDEARRDKLSGGLMLAVGIKPDGSVYSVQLQQSSGHAALDSAARNIISLAAPFAPLPQEIRNEVDILVITRIWRFDSNYHLETRAH